MYHRCPERRAGGDGAFCIYTEHHEDPGRHQASCGLAPGPREEAGECQADQVWLCGTWEKEIWAGPEGDLKVWSAGPQHCQLKGCLGRWGTGGFQNQGMSPQSQQ